MESHARAGTTKCLGCRRAVKCAAGEDPARAPGLCADCAGEEGRLEAVLLELQAGQNRLEARLAATHALCARCHSGGLAGPVLCENGECSVRARACPKKPSKNPKALGTPQHIFRNLDNSLAL